MVEYRGKRNLGLIRVRKYSSLINKFAVLRVSLDNYGDNLKNMSNKFFVPFKMIQIYTSILLDFNQINRQSHYYYVPKRFK